MNAPAREFLKENLAACCREWEEWDKTGLLPNPSKVRELADLLYAPRAGLEIARNMVCTAAVAEMAKQGVEKTGPRTIADEIKDFEETPASAKSLIRRLTEKLIEAKCPSCGSAVGISLST